MKEHHLLVIGSDGLVGKALCSRALQGEVHVTNLSHRGTATGLGEKAVKFDLTDKVPLAGLELGSSRIEFERSTN